MVQNRLQDGYPKLNIDTGTASDTNFNNRDGEESLAYLFDPAIEHEGKETYRDVQGLLQVDDEGYYYYDSRVNYAVYYEETNSFVLYDCPGVIPGGSSPVGQYFPFNQAAGNAHPDHG